ncbi:Uncharacterised protein [Bordetella ansorpii]|uniref:Uncharacterized protein n=1 Tax=Bordetella ansorpii TaxID=288768 RepID=A0A157SRK5_9BORD|nr:hypothetical protein [Bordetella ansorpii]SAI72934.1 Uncharacterised protein [Bordetella ansorpii]
MDDTPHVSNNDEAPEDRDELEVRVAQAERDVQLFNERYMLMQKAIKAHVFKNKDEAHADLQKRGFIGDLERFKSLWIARQYRDKRNAKKQDGS